MANIIFLMTCVHLVNALSFLAQLNVNRKTLFCAVSDMIQYKANKHVNVHHTEVNYLQSYRTSEKGKGQLNRVNINYFSTIYDVHLLKRYGEYMSMVNCPTSTIIPTLNMRVGSLIFLTQRLDNLGKPIMYSSFNPITKEMVFVFRGSTSKADWATDASLAMITPFGNVSFPILQSHLVHKGFWNRFLKYRDSATIDLLQSITKARERIAGDIDVIIVGHSLGGAWALIQSADWVSQGINLKAIYTYGMPLIGNQEFVDYLANIINPSKIVRVVNGNDGIPYMGLTNMAHPSKVPEIFFKEDTNDPIVCQAKIGGDPNCSKSFPCKDWDLADHSKVGELSLKKDICFFTKTIPESIYS
jgi:predicted lipase